MTRRTIIFSLSVLILAAAFRSTLVSTAWLSVTKDSYSYILALAFLTAYTVWSERTFIFAAPTESYWPATLFVIPALLSLFLASRYSERLDSSELLALSAFALVCFFATAFGLCYGRRTLMAGRFPILLLFLMVPLPSVAIDKITYWLQAGSAFLVQLIFEAVGVPVLREGFTFFVPGATIEIAKECSGIRSTTALFILILLIARVTLKTKWRRALLVLTIFPLSILKNAIRIATLTLLAIHVNPSFLHGWLHHSGGFLFFLLSIAVMLPLAAALHKWEDRSAAHGGSSGRALAQSVI